MNSLEKEKKKQILEDVFPLEANFLLFSSLSKYPRIRSPLILVLATSPYVSSADSEPQQEKGQGIYSCDPHDLKLAGRLAKHSVMLKLFPEQQAPLQANQLKGCQTYQPMFSSTVLLRPSKW